MGRYYDGPYAEIVHDGTKYGHEGYAARELPDGTLTSTWNAAPDEHVAQVAACACGWTGTTKFPPYLAEGSDDDALAEWERLHLVPLIVAAAADWPRWAERVTATAAAAARYVTDPNELRRGAALLEDLAADLADRARIARELVDQAEQLAQAGEYR